MKILFIEQHSMKLGNSVFYTMESSRQKYLNAIEAWPYIGGVLSVVYFIGFALRTPMHSKLVKETGLSLLLGMSTAAAYPYYYKNIYMTNVCRVYDGLRQAIERNPALAKPDDDVAITKNFGPSKWNTKDTGLETDEDVDAESRVDIFEGHADDAGKANVNAVLEMA